MDGPALSNSLPGHSGAQTREDKMQAVLLFEASNSESASRLECMCSSFEPIVMVKGFGTRWESSLSGRHSFSPQRGRNTVCAWSKCLDTMERKKNKDAWTHKHERQTDRQTINNGEVNYTRCSESLRRGSVVKPLPHRCEHLNSDP